MYFFFFCSITDDRTEEEQAEARVPGSSSAQPSHRGPLKEEAGLKAPTGRSAEPRDCRLTVKKTKNKNADTYSSLKNNTCIQSALTITDVKKNARRLHLIFDAAPFSKTQSQPDGIQTVPYALARPRAAEEGNSSLWMISQARHTSNSVV